jgi:hypothetical protein
MLVHTRQRGPNTDAYSPIRLRVHRKRPRTVTQEQQTQLLDACTHLRDRFFLLLLFESDSFSGGDRCGGG